MNKLPSSYEAKLDSAKIFWLGLLGYLVLTILSIFFYKERTIFADAAFRFYEMLQSGSYTIQANRFGSFFTQSFIYGGYVLGLPLKYIMIGYSACFIFYKALAFFLCFKWLKNPVLAVTLLLTDVLMVSETFYWIQNELIEGIPFCILYFAVLEQLIAKERSSLMSFLWITTALGLLITSIFFHPLMIIVFVFISLFLLMRKTDKIYKKHLIGGLFLAVILVVIKSIFFSSTYDNTTSDALNNIVKLFPDYWSIPANAQFLQYLIQDYYYLPLFFFALLGFYIKKQRWLSFAYLFASCIGYLFLINVCFPDNMLQFHLEAFYLPISLFLAFAFAIDLLPRLKEKQILLILSLVLTTRIVHIGFQHEQYTARLDWCRSVLDQTADYGNKKLLIHDLKVPMDKVMLTWGSPYEFWMLSSLEYDEMRSVLIYTQENREQLMKWGEIYEKNVFLTRWGVPKYKDLHKPYFDFQDTTSYVDYNEYFL